MKFVFFIDRFITGGVEKVLAELSRRLTENGHGVCFVIGSPPSTSVDIGSAEVLVLKASDYSKLSVFRPRAGSLLCDRLKEADVYMATAPLALAISYNCVRLLNNRAKLIIGVFAQDAFPSNMTYHHRLFRDGVHDRNKLFMNSIVREWHRTLGAAQFRESVIWPIPIDTKDYSKIVRYPQKETIVSVGRLSDFKPYNYQMPGVLRWLVDRGVDAKWEVIGDDEIRNQSIKALMYEAAKLHGVSDRITFHGTRDDVFICSVLSRAGVFIGMGMAAVQAASAGVPVVVAVAKNPNPTSYGLLHELDTGHMGELIPQNLPSRAIGEEILKVILADKQAYSDLSEKSRLTAQFYQSGHCYQIFIDAVEGAHTNVKRVSTAGIYKCSKIVRSILRRIVRYQNL